MMDFDGNTSCDSYSDLENESYASDDEFFEESNKTTDSEFRKFEVLTAEQIVEEMAEYISDVNSMINLPRSTIRNLLNHFKWDKEELKAQYFEGTEETFFGRAKILNLFNKPKEIFKPNVQDSGTADCNVCFISYPRNSIMTGLECGHMFCKKCWDEYLTIKIMNDGHAQFIECPAYGCDILIDDVTVIKLLTDPAVKVKYQQLIANNFVECSRFLRWCPSAGCTYAIKVFFIEYDIPVVCKCSHRFCFACGENWHDPINCKMLKNWFKKCSDADDTESSNWIVTNTKECPKCCTNIEKNGGCNRMLCRKESCRYQFCWSCMDHFKNYGHRCSQYNMEKLKSAKNGKLKVKLLRERYLHYYHRYMNHMQSLKFEKKLYESLKREMEQMRGNKNLSNTGNFLIPAVEVLCKCRQTLMYTYVFAFYLKNNNHSLIFEHNQNDLETATEMLSEYVGRDLTKDLADLVEDKYEYCEERRKILLDHVHEGYEKGFWDMHE